MPTEAGDRLRQIIRDCGEGWVLDFFGDEEQALGELRQRLNAAYRDFGTRFPNSDPPFNDAAIFRESTENPHKVRAFVQALTSTSSPQILVMVWRILQGKGIMAVEMQYGFRGTFHLRVELSDSITDQREQYESSDIDDASVLRHLGIMKVDQQPVFDGFYALRLS